MRQTQIIATLGPSTEDPKVLRALIDSGMNIARLNFSHGNTEQFKTLTKNVREMAAQILVMQDLSGPKIRLDHFKETVRVELGEEIAVPTNYPLHEIVELGHRVLINDGYVAGEVSKIEDEKVWIKITDDGEFEGEDGVNLPDSQLPAHQKLSAKDLADLKFGIEELGVDVVALSFVETAEDIQNLRTEISKLTDREIKICAKIERPKALENLDEIIEASDWLMVARGDLGIEINPERVPVEQKRIIDSNKAAGKFVIVATQMLQSMVNNPLPTRAEVSDVARAVYEGANAVMLSNESASGKFPVEAVKMMDKIALNVEASL